MPRKERADKGLPRENYQGIARKKRNTTRGGTKYNIKVVEPRGKQPTESRIMLSFWKNHNMEDAITWSAAELEEKVSVFFEDYEARQLKAHGHKWWYPDDPANRVIDLRYNK